MNQAQQRSVKSRQRYYIRSQL